MKFAVIGRNFVVDSMMSAASRIPGLEAAAIYSRTADGAREFGENYGVERRYTDISALAGDPDVDFVYIASPNYAHFEQSRLMLESGKHVFCEKPLVPTAAEADELYSLARARGLVLMEAMMPAHTPALEDLRSLLSRIGSVRQAHFAFCQYSSRYDKFRAGIVENAFRPELCNGSLMDLGVYCAELAVMLFGAPLSAEGSACFLSTGADAAVSAVLRYPDMTASLSCSKVSQATLPSYIQGEDGSIEIDFVSHPEKFTLKLRSGEVEQIDATPDLPIMCYELEDMMRAVEQARRGERSVADKYEAYTRDTVALLEQIRLSAGINFTPAGVTGGKCQGFR